MSISAPVVYWIPPQSLSFPLRRLNDPSWLTLCSSIAFRLPRLSTSTNKKRPIDPSERMPIDCVNLSALALLVAVRHALFLYFERSSFLSNFSSCFYEYLVFPCSIRARLSPFPDLLSIFRCVVLNLHYFVPILRKFASGSLRTQYCRLGRQTGRLLAGDLGSISCRNLQFTPCLHNAPLFDFHSPLECSDLP